MIEKKQIVSSLELSTINSSKAKTSTSAPTSARSTLSVSAVSAKSDKDYEVPKAVKNSTPHKTKKLVTEKSKGNKATTKSTTTPSAPKLKNTPLIDARKKTSNTAPGRSRSSSINSKIKELTTKPSETVQNTQKVSNKPMTSPPAATTPQVAKESAGKMESKPVAPKDKDIKTKGKSTAPVPTTDKQIKDHPPKEHPSVNRILPTMLLGCY